MWIGFSIAWRACAGVLLSRVFLIDVTGTGYLVGGLISCGLFLLVALYAAPRDPESVSTFLIVVYTLGIIAELMLDPFILPIYFLFFIPMYKVYQGSLYGDKLVKNDDVHGMRYKEYRCDPDVDQTERCLIYNNRHLDKDKLLRGEIEYLSTLPREQLEDGYNRFKKNKKLKRKAPVFRKILLEAYNSVLFPENQIDSDVLTGSTEVCFEATRCKNGRGQARKDIGKLDADEEGFSWLKAIEEAEENSRAGDAELLPEEFEDDSWLDLVDAAESVKEKSHGQKGKKSDRNKDTMKYIFGGAAIIACVIVGGFAAVVGLTHVVNRNNTVASTLAEEDAEGATETTEQSEITDSRAEYKLTVEDQEEVAAGVAERKAEREKRKATNSSSAQGDSLQEQEDNVVQANSENLATGVSAAAETGTVDETAATTDTYLEDTYNSYAAQIQSESASLVSQMQAGSIDYMTASQQLSNLYYTGRQAMTTYWQSGNCSYEDMTSWSNKLWSVYTVESPKLVGAGH